jgi:hypothetical protein
MMCHNDETCELNTHKTLRVQGIDSFGRDHQPADLPLQKKPLWPNSLNSNAAEGPPSSNSAQVKTNVQKSTRIANPTVNPKLYRSWTNVTARSR